MPTGMNHGEFFIGCAFMTGRGKRWRCTNMDTRVIVAVCLDDYPDDSSWYNGSSYAVLKRSFDEDDSEGCTPLPS